jgi:hypothetical protein
MALPTEADFQALRQIQIERNGGVDPNATPSEIEKQIAAIDARRGDTAASKIDSDGVGETTEGLSQDETQQLKDNAGGSDEKDPFADAWENMSKDERPSPTEADVLASMSEEEKSKAAGTSTADYKKEVNYVPVKELRKNPLHDYATYTYSIALYILSQADINQLTASPETWVPSAGGKNTCLIASGGKNSGPYKRNDNFQDDFYFDNLQMTTVIGLNNRSKASNAIEISFTVVEPYGMSLLDRIIDTANDMQAPNFKAMPYMLEIDFYGYDDKGNASKLDNQRKRMPIQIVEFKIKVSTKGSEYAIKAVPWSHQALSQSSASTPINIEVSASKVSEFFANNEEDFESIAQQDLAKLNAQDQNQRIEKNTAEEKLDKSGRRTAANDPRVAGNKTEPDKSARTTAQSETLKENQAIIGKAYAVKSFCGGMNGWYTDLTAKRLRATADKILVEFHGTPEVPVEKIRDAKITVPARKDVSRSATTTSDPKEAKEQSNDTTKKVFGDAMAFPVAAGTSVLHVIDMVMRNSSYITDQISDPKDTKPVDLAEKLKKPLYWYKIIPSVKAGKFDYAINKFSTETTYHIVPYIVYDSKHPNGPVTTPKGAIKEYNYSYTGKNVDVLDLQIDFDTLFYTAVTAGSAKWQADQIQKAKQQLDDAQNAAVTKGPTAKALVTRQLRLISTQPQQQGLGGQQGSAEQILAADIQKSQYSNSRGDMLNLKLKIVGDPELIKQDDIYTNPAQGGYADQANSPVMDNGSIPMDSGEVIAQVNFRTIVDMDQTTGLPRVGADANKSIFSGYYRMLTVSNVFQGGRFEQTVDMVRVPDVEKASTSEKTEEAPNATAPGARQPISGASGADMDAAYDMGEVPSGGASGADMDAAYDIGDAPDPDTPDVELVDDPDTTIPDDDEWNTDDGELYGVDETAEEMDISEYNSEQDSDPVDQPVINADAPQVLPDLNLGQA